MSDPRMTGLALMAVSIAAFMGTTSQMLPSVVFFPALLLFAIGAFKFVRSNSEAMAQAEERAHKRVNPRIRQNRHAQAHAERIAARRGSALASFDDAEGEAEQAARMASGAGHRADAIELDESETDFVVTTDVSFPVEVQTGDALADQLQKLNKLLEQGVLTEEEYAVAKAKLLG